jgi:hypothetical protein
MVDGLGLLDMDPYGREIDDPLAELYQDLVHRLLETPGSNVADEDRGVGIVAALSSSTSATRIARIIELDFAKDPRVQTCAASLSPAGDDVYRIDIQVVCDEGQLGIKLDVNPDGTVREVQ